jgi:hypothetical protein
VRQGDPLSSLLFVIAADLLQSIVNSAALEGLLHHPLGHNFGGDYPIIQYTDDTLLIMPAEESQLLNLKNILGAYSVSAGLKVNYSKSSIIPINSVLGCRVRSIPFTYLGLPLGTTRPSVQDFLPLLNRIERRMMGINSLVSYICRSNDHGQFSLINVTHLLPWHSENPC